MPPSVSLHFGPFVLDPGKHRLTRGAEVIALSDRHLDVLALLAARAGEVVSKEDLLQAGWQEVAVGDNSLEQAISSLRRHLGSCADGGSYILTVARRGYRLGVPVERRASRESDARLEVLLSPYRAFVEGRAALETLERGQVARAREVFEQAVATVPDHASAHVGLANACVMSFEATRADREPDTVALTMAAQHAREACRLDAGNGEAWATLGFVLDRTGHHLDAVAACKRAISLEPDNWRHSLRLSYVSWGEERLRAAQRTLALLPDLPLARWLAATVHVARQAYGEAERELRAALASAHGSAPNGASRFSLVAVHWLLGLLYLERGDEARALEEFDQELALEATGHLYARECAGAAWYAIGAARFRQGRAAEACAAFEAALERVPVHPMARAALVIIRGAGAELSRPPGSQDVQLAPAARAVDIAMAGALSLALGGAHVDAARRVAAALGEAASRQAGWLLPFEPLLHPRAHPDAWAHALALLRQRAA